VAWPKPIRLAIPGRALAMSFEGFQRVHKRVHFRPLLAWFWTLGNPKYVYLEHTDMLYSAYPASSTLCTALATWHPKYHIRDPIWDPFRDPIWDTRKPVRLVPA